MCMKSVGKRTEAHAGSFRDLSPEQRIAYKRIYRAYGHCLPILRVCNRTENLRTRGLKLCYVKNFEINKILT